MGVVGTYVYGYAGYHVYGFGHSVRFYGTLYGDFRRSYHGFLGVVLLGTVRGSGVVGSIGGFELGNLFGVLRGGVLGTLIYVVVVTTGTRDQLTTSGFYNARVENRGSGYVLG